MSEDCRSKVMMIIEKALEIESGVLSIESDADTIENWDSLGQLSILVSLDKHFDGKISSLSEMAEANSVSKILKILEKNSIC